MYVADGPPLQLGTMDVMRRVLEIEREAGPCVDRSAVMRWSWRQAAGSRESLFGRRNSAVMLTPQRERQWVAVQVRKGKFTRGRG